DTDALTAASPVSPEAALDAISRPDEDGTDYLLTHPSSARDDHPTQFHIAHPVAYFATMPVKAKMPSERSQLMASIPAQASVVVVGAGIVGNSLVHHLAELGWTDIVQVDKGPLPNPGGSTGHASNFIFPVDHSREITDLTLDSMRQYKELGVFTESGGFEVARTEERMQELARRMASARAWGIESQLVTPAEIAEKVPCRDPEVIVGGFWTPTVGVVDSVRAGTMMRES